MGEWVKSVLAALILVALVSSCAVWFVSAIDREQTACNIKGGTLSYDAVHKKFRCSK